jgi:hypothetical protein
MGKQVYFFLSNKGSRFFKYGIKGYFFLLGT